MKRSTLQLIFILPLTAALAIACAPDKNKKDRLTRISGRSKIITQKPQTQADQNKTIATPAETAGATPVAAEPTVATVVDGTELCRITDDPALDEAFIEQAFCDGMDVDVEADGKIIFAQKHSLLNLAPREFKLEDIKLKNKAVRLEWASVQQKENNTLTLGFKIPHKKSELDLDEKNIELALNGKFVSIESIAVVLPVDAEGYETGDVIVRLKDASKIENINFNIAITYTIK